MTMGTAQKQNIAIQHRIRNQSTQVLDFRPWLLNIRLPLLKQAGAKIRVCEFENVLYVELTWDKQKPRIFTEEDFRVEYKDTYLASFGLACECKFEENAGIDGQKTTA